TVPPWSPTSHRRRRRTLPVRRLAWTAALGCDNRRRTERGRTDASLSREVSFGGDDNASEGRHTSCREGRCGARRREGVELRHTDPPPDEASAPGPPLDAVRFRCGVSLARPRESGNDPRRPRRTRVTSAALPGDAAGNGRAGGPNQLVWQDD